MINRRCSKYCCEPLDQIENYLVAVNDKERMWHCHHRLETEGAKLSMRLLVKRGLYYKRPAAELIFLTPEDHQRVHKPDIITNKLAKHPNMVTFQDFLVEKRKVVKKYEFWIQRKPEMKERYIAQMKAEINELFEIYEAHETGYFRKAQEAGIYGGSLKRKLITQKKGEFNGYN